MINKETLEHIVNNRLDGYLEAVIEAYPSTKELFSDASPLDKLMKASAIKGMYWYIQELWHPVKDIPQEGYGKYILALTKYDGPQVIDVDEYMDREEYEDFEEEETWDDIVEEENITKWCYVSELLPQKGDNNE